MASLACQVSDERNNQLRLTYLVTKKNLKNESFSKGIFPDKLKVANVIPVFKADEPDLFTNYRPISLLPNFSKFFEKVMHNRLVEFANSHDIFYQLQFGFRINHSTVLLLIYLVKEARNSFSFPQTSFTNSFPITVWLIV